MVIHLFSQKCSLTLFEMLDDSSLIHVVSIKPLFGGDITPTRNMQDSTAFSQISRGTGFLALSVIDRALQAKDKASIKQDKNTFSHPILRITCFEVCSMTDPYILQLPSTAKISFPRIPTRYICMVLILLPLPKNLKS